MDLLIGIVFLALLITLLVKQGTSNGEIDKLKQRLSKLELELDDFRRPHLKTTKSDEQTESSPVAAQPIPKTVSASNLPETSVAQASYPQSPKVSGPPPIPKPKRTGSLDFLRSIGLWPPVRKKGSAELVLMQWWMPRIGGILAILTIIFIAVYVAQGTAPWVKFLEMLVASFGVFGLGLFFSKKRPDFGNVLMATGLSMIYISSVAGYAVGPVKVVDSPLLGALMQVAALILNFGMGTWRKDRGMLILALVFGYISSLFAALEGFREAALLSSLLVYVAGIISYRRIGGLTIASLSLAGVYLPLAGFVGIKYLKEAAVFPEYWSVIVFLVLTVSILPACKLYFKDPAFVDSSWNRLYQSLNTSFAIGLGYLFVNEFYRNGRTEFYGVFAILFVAWSIVWFLRDTKGIEYHLFLLKGSALASLWFINYYAGDLRWMALGIQVIILAASVHRSKSIWVEIVTGITWLVSFYYFIYPGSFDAVWSLVWFIQGAYILNSVAGLGYLMAYVSGKQIWRRVIYAVPAIILAATATEFAADSNILGYNDSGVIAIMALLILSISLLAVVRVWVPLVAGGLVFVASHLSFWPDPDDKYSLLVVLLVSAVCLFGLLKAKIVKQNIAETLVHGLWVVSVLYFFSNFQFEPWYSVLIALFSILLFTGGFSPLKRLPEVCVLPLLFLLLHPPRGDVPGVFLFFFVLMLGALANVAVVFPRFQQFVYFLKRGDLLMWLINALFIFWAGWTFSNHVSLANELLLWTALGAMFFFLWYWRSMWVSFVGALFCAAVPVYRITILWFDPIVDGLLGGAPWAWQVLLAGLISMILWLVIGGLPRIRPHAMLKMQSEQLLAWVSGLMGYLVFVATFSYPLLNWDRLYTPCLAAFSIGLIVLGIILKSKPFRFVAMLTFLVALFRLFTYDIRETLFRIIAFAVLTVFMTVIGFLYQRYSSRIE